MTRNQIISFFETLAARHLPEWSFEQSPRRLKESNRSDISYPVLVLDEQPDFALTGSEDNLLEEERWGVMVLAQAASESTDDINKAWQTAREMAREVISYLEGWKREQMYSDEPFADYLEVLGERVRAVNQYTSDWLYGYRLSVVSVESVDYSFDVSKWSDI